MIIIQYLHNKKNIQNPFVDHRDAYFLLDYFKRNKYSDGIQITAYFKVKLKPQNIKNNIKQNAAIG